MRKATVTISNVTSVFHGITRRDNWTTGAEVDLRGEPIAVQNAVIDLRLDPRNIENDEEIVEVMNLGDFLTDLGNYLRLGNKINAIKRLKDVSGLGLKDCKDIIDNLSYRPEQPF